MSQWDAIGYFAAGMVFVAFGMKDMIPLRIVLLPLNGWRLAQALRCSGRMNRIDPDVGESGVPVLCRFVVTKREARTTGIRTESTGLPARRPASGPDNSL
jgi:hypothetical protein